MSDQLRKLEGLAKTVVPKKEQKAQKAQKRRKISSKSMRQVFAQWFGEYLEAGNDLNDPEQIAWAAFQAAWAESGERGRRQGRNQGRWSANKRK